MKKKDIVLSLVTGTLITAGAAALIIFFVVPTTFRDYNIRRGSGIEATAVVTGYRETGRENNQPRYALILRINADSTIMAETEGAFSRYALQNMGVWDGQEREVKVRYLGTRAIIDGQPSSFPVVLMVALMFGGFGILVIIATIFYAITGRHLISEEMTKKLSDINKMLHLKR